VPTLNDLRKKLTSEQRELLGAIWNYYCTRGRWIPCRVLHQGFKQLRKHGVRAALVPLGGSIVYEAKEPSEEVYKVTLLGALLTGQGWELERCLGRFLGYFRDRFENDPEISGLTGQDIREGLRLTDEQALVLFNLVWIGPLCGGGGNSGRNLDAWKFGLPYDIEDIPEEVESYLEALVLRNYDPAVPFEANAREQYDFRKSGVYSFADRATDDETACPFGGPA